MGYLTVSYTLQSCHIIMEHPTTCFLPSSPYHHTVSVSEPSTNCSLSLCHILNCVIYFTIVSYNYGTPHNVFSPSSSYQHTVSVSEPSTNCSLSLCHILNC